MIIQVNGWMISTIVLGFLLVYSWYKFFKVLASIKDAAAELEEEISKYDKEFSAMRILRRYLQ